MIDSVRASENLIVCVDSANPQLSVFRKGFSKLLERVSRGRPGGLNLRRLLVLFTKVDAAAQAALEGANRAYLELNSDEHPTLALRLLKRSRVTALRLVQLLDPIEFARATLDQASLSMVFKALNPKAEMAVCVCSSTGFYPDGSPFWNEQRDEIWPRSAQSDDDRLRNWMPFGVEDAILFLMTGRTCPTVAGMAGRKTRALEALRAPNACCSN